MQVAGNTTTITGVKSLIDRGKERIIESAGHSQSTGTYQNNVEPDCGRLW
jgi:hypothetical protein